MSTGRTTTELRSPNTQRPRAKPLNKQGAALISRQRGFRSQSLNRSHSSNQVSAAILCGKVAEVKSSWSDRIPFVLLFGIATSVELFQEKLSRETIRYLDGSVFDVQQVDVEDIFKEFQSEQTTLWVGPGLSRFILQRQKDYIQSHSSFINALKVMTSVPPCLSLYVDAAFSTPI